MQLQFNRSWGDILDYLRAFIVGGLICAAGQILIDKTKLTPGRILVIFVTTGAILSGLGVYQYLINIGGAGAAVPILGFGHSLTTGAIKGIHEKGIIGAFTGGVSQTAAGITAAVVFGYLFSVLFKPNPKR